MGPPIPRRVWFWRASSLAGPWIGVPGCRPPIWFGGDEFDRRTIVFHLPGVGCAIIAIGRATQP
jgi:hypothetical protein